MDLELVEERLPVGSEVRTIQSGVIEQIIRLDSTVTRALNVARSGFSDMAPVALGLCIDGAVRATMPRITERGVRLRVACADDCMVRGDAAALQQLFSNLLRNAADACQDGDSIDLRCAIVEDRAVVSVTDSGAGMSPATLARAFEPMFSTKSDGTGVGLAIARRIADAHSAVIEIDSTEGAGTTVTVSFPT
jgi:two-component system sensor histidine kinase AtoS